MTESNDKINQLLNKLELLLKKQEDFSTEINVLKSEISKLKIQETKEDIKKDILTSKRNFEVKKEDINAGYSFSQQQPKIAPLEYTQPTVSKFPKKERNFEKIIGENLINKIGIAITIIGVAIGAKYSIEHDLVSPLTRIILGYLAGVGLLGFGIKLKKKYESYSAVLVSGAMAVLYFITYFAYGFYGLIPQILTFVLMLLFTAFTVVAAINYNKQVIAHIGLVGAYAIPFLLSGGSGQIAILFTYMAIINIGILVIGFKKYWKPLYYSSFGLTWLIYSVWYMLTYKIDEHFALALTFLTIFFVTFYLTSSAYKLIQKEKFKIDDIILLLCNSFIFFGIGYAILNEDQTGNQLLGLFTLCNAIIHFTVSIVIKKQKLADKNLLYLILGLVLIFITIAIPVQLDGNWVTLLWAGEATLLFWIGRTKNVPIYEKLSYPLMILALFSIIHDWATVYDMYDPAQIELRTIHDSEHIRKKITPLLNVHFLTSSLFIIAFGFINFINRIKKYSSVWASPSQQWISKIISIFLPTILLFSIYYAFRMEISTYWNQLYAHSALLLNSKNNLNANYVWNDDLLNFKTIWIINYSMLFVSLLSFLNSKKLKDQQLGLVNLILIALVIIFFLIQGLYTLSELHESYLQQTSSQYYYRGIFHIGIRYVSFLFITLALITCHKCIRKDFMQQNLGIPFDYLLYTSILWIVSSELITWMKIADSTQSYKLGLSILWGVYSLLLIALGIWKKKKHLRIVAISLFTVTLLKLFLYDISYLSTIAKTIVFVSLGVLLLIISFLYNKYRYLISDETKN